MFYYFLSSSRGKLLGPCLFFLVHFGKILWASGSRVRFFFKPFIAWKTRAINSKLNSQMGNSWKLVPSVPISLSQHNQMPGGHPGLPASHPDPAAHQFSTTLPHQELLCLKIDLEKKKKRVIFSWINSPVWFPAWPHKYLRWHSWKDAVGVGMSSHRCEEEEEARNCMHHQKSGCALGVLRPDPQWVRP